MIGENSTICDTDCETPNYIKIDEGVVIGQDVTVAPNTIIDAFSEIPAGTTVSGTWP